MPLLLLVARFGCIIRGRVPRTCDILLDAKWVVSRGAGGAGAELAVLWGAGGHLAGAAAARGVHGAAGAPPARVSAGGSCGAKETGRR